MKVTHIQSCYRSVTPRRPVRCETSDGARPSSCGSPIQPPWKVLPWPNPRVPVHHRPAAVVAAVKSPLGAADVNGVGRTLDLFV